MQNFSNLYCNNERVVTPTVSPIFLAGIAAALLLNEQAKMAAIALIDDVAGQIKR